MRNFIKILGLRAQLLRLWFIKNIKTFLITAIIIYFILIITGRVTGGPLFSYIYDYIDQFTRELENGNIIDTIMNIIAISLSVSTGAGMLLCKTKTLTLKDIKSKKLKRAMVQSGLYFNPNGKLVKKVEMYTQHDLTGDGKIVNKTEDELYDNKPDFGIFRAASELYTIATSKIEVQDDVNDIVEKTSLKNVQDMDEAIEADDYVDVEVVDEKTGKKHVKRKHKHSWFPFRRKTLTEAVRELPEEKQISEITDSEIIESSQKKEKKKQGKTVKEEKKKETSKTVETSDSHKSHKETENIEQPNAATQHISAVENNSSKEKKTEALIDRRHQLYGK